MFCRIISPLAICQMIFVFKNGRFIFSRLLFRNIEATAYVYIYNNYRIYEFPWESPITWFVAFLLVDLGYYWVHRMAHGKQQRRVFRSIGNTFSPIKTYLLESPYSTGNWVCVWLPNANEIDTNNMKCTWPMRRFCVWYPTQHIFH